MGNVKKCLLLFAGIPEWDLIQPAHDGWPESIVESIRFRHYWPKWNKCLIEKNPDVEFHAIFAWDSTFFSPSGSYLEKELKLKKRYVPARQTIGWIREHCIGERYLSKVDVTDSSMVDEGAQWRMPEALGDQVIYSPNTIPFIRMLRMFQATKNDGYDYFVYARPDSFIKRSLYLDQFENTASIFSPSDNWGGLFFDNKDFDYMWAGDYEAVQKLLRLWCGAPHIQLQDGINVKISDQEKFDLCAKHDLFGKQFRKKDDVWESNWTGKTLEPEFRRYLIEIEDYWYGCIKHFVDLGYNFSTSHNHGIQCLQKQAMMKPHPHYSRGEKPW